MFEILVSVVLLALPPGGALASAAPEQQSPLLPEHGPPDLAAQNYKHIAIVGAGIGGASTAWHIHERNRNERTEEITIFEKESNVGGRIKSTYLYPGSGGLATIEEGATHLFEEDWCLKHAADNVGLKLERDLRTPARSWHLSRFAANEKDRTELKCTASSTTWKENLQRRWKYGRSWPLFSSAVEAALEKWNSFATIYYQPFNRITEELGNHGFSEHIPEPAEAYLKNLTISPQLQNELIQPCIRGRMSQNLAGVSGLSSLLAAGKSDTSIHGGNSRLVERMIRLSEADLRLNSTVTSISPGLSKRYQVSTSHLTPNGSSLLDTAEFDMVVIAAPLQPGEIDLSSFDMQTRASSPPRIDTYVTHFASPWPVTNIQSILPLDIEILGERTLTTSSLSDDPKILNVQRYRACFARGCLPGDDCDECDVDRHLYRVHSRQYLDDSDIIRMIGGRPEFSKDLRHYGIQFVRRKTWPRSFLGKPTDGRLDFADEIQIAPDLYHLNGAESVLSSMEMSCRMARNVVRKTDPSRKYWV